MLTRATLTKALSARATSTRDASGASTRGATSSAPMQFNLTAAGWVVVLMMVAALFISGTNRIAVGFLIPLAAAVVIDLYVSWLFLDRQSISLIPSRTVAHHPDGIPVRVSSTGGDRPVVATLAFAGAELDVGLHDEPVTVELQKEHTGAADYVRAKLVCSVLGLATAQRWQTHVVAMLHWSPAPDDERIPTPDAVDEVARLRTYVPGDRMSRVSWPVTARTGQMHVRAAGEGHEDFTVVLNMAGPVDVQDAASAPVRRTATLVTQLLEDGHQVRLVTTELDPTHRKTLRRSAVAEPRYEPALTSDTSEPVVVDRFVSDEDDLARRLALAVAGPTVTWPYGTWVEISSAGIRTLP